jgi:hypothetical protein
VKIRIDQGGAHAARPDFAMLRAEFFMAQSATPTALASSKARASRAQAESLLRLFAGMSAADLAVGSGSFHAGLTPRDGDGDENRPKS